ncbi:MAG: hypothetical protein E6G10_17740 [Actinobacteria bacterium]|nr:MAG: hypothetical protein E6G10_17740 [Actinomycetota bacterium]
MKPLLAAVAVLALALPASSQAAFPGRNGRILFTSADRLYTVDPAGGPWTRLVADETRQGQAAWSPDGARVAFRVGPDGDSEIWVVNADGTGAHPITDTPNPAANDPRYSSQPAWSPDGRQIVFRSDRRDNNPDVWIMDADGANPRPLVTTPGDERYPALSPDGTRLVYRSDIDGDPEIYVARADGTDPVKLTDNAIFDSAPSWSPDGARIAFERGELGADDPRNATYATMELWTMAADGSDQQRLTVNDVHDEGPAWAPDGSGAVVFTRDDKVNSDLWIRDAAGAERRLTDAPSLEESPDWQALPSEAGAPPSEPPASTPAQSPSTTPRPAARIVLLTRRARVSRTGRLAVRVRCVAPCAGTLSLTRGGVRLARAPLRAAAGRTVLVRLRLGPRTLRRLRAARRLAVDVRAARGRLVLVAPR